MAEKRERNQAAYKRLLASYQGQACHWCGITGVPMTVDHLVERARGGTIADGTVPACKSCNSKRGQAFVTERQRTKYQNPKFR